MLKSINQIKIYTFALIAFNSFRTFTFFSIRVFSTPQFELGLICVCVKG